MRTAAARPAFLQKTCRRTLGTLYICTCARSVALGPDARRPSTGLPSTIVFLQKGPNFCVARSTSCYLPGARAKCRTTSQRKSAVSIASACGRPLAVLISGSFGLGPGRFGLASTSGFSMVSSDEAQDAVVAASVDACKKINVFAKEVLHTRGGRIGSGMGTLLEALWGYFTNHGIGGRFQGDDRCELAWMYGHEYNDFALVLSCEEWKPETRQGELLRVETKSMVASADESKAHFDQIQRQLTEFDLLTILVWDWVKLDDARVCPQILDHFVAPALPIAKLRDALHLARGGSFVDPKKCPDKCEPKHCKHAGEPLNEKGKRERLSGPEACRVSQKVSYAANFGGMVRMLKTDSENARKILRIARRDDDVAHAYVSFIHRCFPKEELNQYTADEWRQLAALVGVQGTAGLKKDELVQSIRQQYPQYRKQLRDLSKRIAVPQPTPEDVSEGGIPHAGTPLESPCSDQASAELSDAERAGDLQTLLRQIRDGSGPS